MHIAKIFMSGRSQAVRLPLEFRFNQSEVFIHRDPHTGDVVLSTRPTTWDALRVLDASTEVPEDFLSDADRNQGADRDMSL
jgi:antitoxin VapB